MTAIAASGKVRAAIAFGDRHFRHELRNLRNSLGLALRAYDISNDSERVELLDMVIETVDQAIVLLDANEPDATGPGDQSDGADDRPVKDAGN